MSGIISISLSITSRVGVSIPRRAQPGKSSLVSEVLLGAGCTLTGAAVSTNVCETETKEANFRKMNNFLHGHSKRKATSQKHTYIIFTP